MHAAHTPVFKLLGDHFEAFRRDTLHQWCEIDSPTSNFTPTRVYNENMSSLVTCLRAK